MLIELISENLDGLAKYANVVLKFFASDEYYEEASSVYLAKQLNAKGNNLHYFLYEDDVDKTKQIVFGFKWSDSYPNPYTQEKGMWKIVDLAYLGNWGDLDKNGISLEALRFGTKLIRQWIDDNKLYCWYIIFNADTAKLATLSADGVMQKSIFLGFLNYVQQVCWEITDTIPLSDGTHFVCHCNRDIKNKPENEESWVRSFV